MLPAVAPNHTVEPYYHERYEPLWSTAEELGFPIHQHQGSGSPDAWPGQDVGRALTYVDLELWTRLTMSHLIVGGVFERHPDPQGGLDRDAGVALGGRRPRAHDATAADRPITLRR